MNLSNKKQLLFVQNSTHLAGAQKSLSRILTHQGMKCFSPVLLTDSEGWLTQFCSNHDVPWLRLDFPTPRSVKDLWLGGNARFAKKAARTIRPYLLPDHDLIVHANDHPDSLIALHLAKVLQSRSFLALRTPGMSRRDFYKHRCSEHDCVIAVGDDLAQRAQQWHINGKIHCIYNGVTANEIRKPNPSLHKTLNRILVIGSLSKRKGWADLVDALILIETRLPDGHFPEVDFLGDLLNKNPLDVLKLDRLKRFRCRFLGVTEDYLQQLQNYSLVIHPSWSESFGMAALECVSAGVPLIAASTGMIPHFITNKSFTYPPGDFQALAEILASILSKSDCQDIFDAFDFETVHSRIRNNFTTDQTLKGLSQLYDNPKIKSLYGDDIFSDTQNSLTPTQAVTDGHLSKSTFDREIGSNPNSLSKKKILFIQKSAGRGGSKFSLMETLSIAVKDPEFDIEILLGEDGELADKCRSIGVLPHYCDIPEYRKFFDRFRFSRSIKKIAFALNGKKFDWIIANEMWQAPYALRLARLLCCKSAVILRDGLATVKKANDYGLGNLNLILPVASSISEKLSCDHRYKYKTRTFYNSVSIPDAKDVDFDNIHKLTIQFPKVERWMTVLGKVCPRKNQIDAIHILDLLHSNGWESFGLLLAGDIDPDYGFKLSKLSSLKKLEHHTLLAGNINGIGALMDCSEIVILTSLREGLPRSLVEAIMSKKIVFSYPCDGVDDIFLNQRHLFVSELSTPESLFEKIAYYLSNKESFDNVFLELFQSINQRFSSFSHTIQLKKLLNEYK